MRRALAVACMVALISVGGASSADAYLVGEVGFRAAPPGHALVVNRGVLAPKTVPSSAPVSYPASVLTSSQVGSYARRAGFPESLIPSMVAIAYHESTFCPSAVNGQGCYGTAKAGGSACGLWQLFPCPGPTYLDPMANAWGARSKCLGAIAAGGSCLDPWGGAP
jgi:hypothetical protein